MNNLKSLRIAHKMSQKRLSRLIAVMPLTIERYETGIREIPENKLIRLSKVFDIPTEEIYSHEKQEE